MGQKCDDFSRTLGQAMYIKLPYIVPLGEVYSAALIAVLGNELLRIDEIQIACDNPRSDLSNQNRCLSLAAGNEMAAGFPPFNFAAA
jgi:hypothetical protein